MQRSHTAPPRQRRRSGAATAMHAGPAESNPSSSRSNRRAVRFGLGLLFLALCVGLAAALFLTVGGAYADVFLVGINAAF